MGLPPELANKVATLRALADVVGGGFDVIDVVVQDEYSHDVVVRHAGHTNLYLVFDTT